MTGPPPKLGPRDIDDYDFLPRWNVVAFDPPQPLGAGWWRDPFNEYPAQRYHDGTRWTQYLFVQPLRGAGHVSEIPAEHRPPRPIDKYSPWPLRTNGSTLLAMACFLGGGVVLAMASALDRHSAPYEWVVRCGLVAVLGSLTALAIHAIRFAAHPKELGPRDSVVWLVPAIYLFHIGGIVIRSWDDVLRSLWLR